METGRHIHDERNSLKSPRPGPRNLRRRQEKYQERVLLPRKDREYKTMEYEPKLVAHSVCVWCSAQSEDGSTFVICPRCQACQYCGLVGNNPDNCLLCGNTAEPDMIRPKPARKRAIQGYHEPHEQKRPESRLRPMTRDRRPRTSSN